MEKRFSLGASHGYEVTVIDIGYSAVLQAARVKDTKPKQGSWTQYLARAKSNPAHIDATFGGLGKVDMRFHQHGSPTKVKRGRGCRTRHISTYRRGIFVGTFRFRGENGYTAVHVHRVKGTTVTRFRPSHCTRSHGEPSVNLRPGDRPKVTRFLAGWHTGPAAQYFFATAKGEDPPLFGAAEYKTTGSLAILRRVIARGAPQAFLTDDALSFATISPPAPFSGTGQLGREASGARTWTGSLAVSFPGEPPVPLVGPQFKTQLTRSF